MHGHLAFDQTCAVISEELALSCKSAKEQVAFGFTATVGGLNRMSEIRLSRSLLLIAAISVDLPTNGHMRAHDGGQKSVLG
jgi:hypothetical protein